MAKGASSVNVPLELTAKPGSSSVVCKYFGFIWEDFNPNTNLCRICYKPVTTKGGNASNLFSHLKSKHIEPLRRFPKTLRDISRPQQQRLHTKNRVNRFSMALQKLFRVSHLTKRQANAGKTSLKLSLFVCQKLGCRFKLGRGKASDTSFICSTQDTACLQGNFTNVGLHALMFMIVHNTSLKGTLFDITGITIKYPLVWLFALKMSGMLFFFYLSRISH